MSDDTGDISSGVPVPTTSGTEGQVLTLHTDGSTTWETPSGGSSVLANDTFFKARDAANSADLDLFKVDTDDNFILYDGAGFSSFDVTNRSIGTADGSGSANFISRTLYDSTSTQSVRWDARTLQDTNSDPSLDWSTPSALSAPVHVINLLFSSQARFSDTQTTVYWGGPTDGLFFDSDKLQTLGNQNDAFFLATTDDATHSTSDIYISTGDATTTGNAGTVYIRGGNSADASGGGITLVGGNGAAGGGPIGLTAGHIIGGGGYFININAGSPDAANFNAGDINIESSGATGTGLNGRLSVNTRAMRVPRNSADPGSPVSADMYYNTTINKLKFYNGSAWETVTSL